MKEIQTDIIGKQYGCYVVLPQYEVRVSSSGTKRTYWKCRCVVCDAIYMVEVSSLRRRTSPHCKACRPIARRRTKLYHVYYGIIQRCYNPNNQSYAKYGAKGIEMDAAWLQSYDTFRVWAYDNGYEEGLTIDRINSADGYTPQNCRWISLSENSGRANIGKHKNHSKLLYMYVIDQDGRRVNISNITAFAKRYGMPISTVCAILHGRFAQKPTKYRGFEFHSNIIDQYESVTTIEKQHELN